MAVYIRCPSCGFCIGKYVLFVDIARNAILNNALSEKYGIYDPEKMIFTNNVLPTLEPLFEALCIKNRCCRMHLVTKTEYDKGYK